jgi:LysM repeat protein
MNRNKILALVCMLLLGALLPLSGRSSAARMPIAAAGVGEILQQVNALRAANGLAPYKSDNALMGAAQAHSDYQAATGTTSHTGKGGSRPRDRAVAWGYGGGAAVYVSENIATGTGMTAAQAVSLWQGDGVHLTTMLSSSYRDAGVGAAEAGGVVYYTLDVGYIAGDEGQPPAAPPGQGGNPGSTPAPAGTPVAVIIPAAAATPRADGSIIHEVQYGQALWNISAMYEVGLPFILTLNGITENTTIYPGDKLIIRPPKATSTPQFSPTPEESATPTPAEATREREPTSTRIMLAPGAISTAGVETPAGVLAKAALQSSPTAEPISNLDSEDGAPTGALAELPSQGIDPLLLVIAGFVVVGTLLLLLGRLLQRGA